VSPAAVAAPPFTYVPRGPAVLIGTTVARHQRHATSGSALAAGGPALRR